MTKDYYKEKKLLAPRCIQVKDFIKYNPNVSNEDIARGLNVKIQSVTPRTKELKENGIVWITNRGRTSSNRTAWLMTLAHCPRCKSHSLSIRKPDSVRFQYHCNNCNYEFTALVGKNRSQEVIIK